MHPGGTLLLGAYLAYGERGANLLTTRECGKVSSKIYIVHYSTFHATSSFWISKFDRMTNDKRDICF